MRLDFLIKHAQQSQADVRSCTRSPPSSVNTQTCITTVSGTGKIRVHLRNFSNTEP